MSWRSLCHFSIFNSEVCTLSVPPQKRTILYSVHLWIKINKNLLSAHIGKITVALIYVALVSGATKMWLTDSCMKLSKPLICTQRQGQTKHFCLYCYLSRSYPCYSFHREIFQVKSAGHEQMLIVKYTPNSFGSLGCGNQDAELIFVRIISISQNDCWGKQLLQA